MKPTQSENSTNKEVMHSDIPYSLNNTGLQSENNPLQIAPRSLLDIIPQYANFIFLLLFAFKFMKLWIAPQPDDAHEILGLAVLMGFEFIMVHSGVAMTVMPRKIALFVFVPLYGLFAFGFNKMVDDHSILILYLVTVVNRMRYAFMNASPEQIQHARASSFFAVAIYFPLLVIIGFGTSYIPHLGLTPDYIDTYIAPIRKVGGGLTEQPHSSMCLGFLYFSLLALVQFMLYEQGYKHKLIKFMVVAIIAILLLFAIPALAA